LVDIYLIVGNDFENLVLLSQNVVNDGSHPVSIPSGITTSTARIMVKAVDNVFFAINSEYLTIQQSEFVFDFDATEYAVCQPDDLIFNFVYNTFVGFSEDVTLTAINVPAGLNVSFNPNMVSVDDTQVEVTVTGTNAMAIGNTSITVVGTSVSLTKNYPIEITILSPTISSPNLLLPTNNSIDIPLDQILSWGSEVNAQQYELEISEQSNFSTIVESYTGSLTGFLPSILQSNTHYFWRVKSINICGESVFSSPFTFTTAIINCDNEFFNAEIIPIDSEGFNMVTSSIYISNVGLLDDIEVSVNISHTYVSDLTLNLTSPAGTTITLVSEACDSGENIDVIFSDAGQSLICETNPTISNIIVPTQQLSTFENEQISGTWTLTVIDNFNGDGGSINSFGLDICARDYYIVNVADESCRELNDGTIIINTEDKSHHTATLNGSNTNTTLSFTANTSFTGLAAGNYTVCISRDNILNSEQCFNVVINEPELLVVQTELNSVTKTVDINLSGASTYIVELNGEVSQVTESNTTLQLANGYNSLMISTGINCNQPYSEIFLVGDKNLVYPSPFESELTLFVTEADKLVNITIHSVNGKLIINEDLRSNERGEIILQLDQLSSGIYIVNIKADGVNNVHKIVKQ
jgi:subtilisin-like proprotein convertase family protein